MSSNSLRSDFIPIIKALALHEVSLCEDQYQLLAARKHWSFYFAAINKYMAGKSLLPYMDEKGKVQYVQ